MMSAAKRIKLDIGPQGPSGRADPRHGAEGSTTTRFGDGSSSSPESTTATFGSLSVDAIAIIFGYLRWRDILLARVCRTFRDAAARTVVPFAADDDEYCVSSLRRFEALSWMARALPLLQQICFQTADLFIGEQLYFEEGEDPEPYPLPQLPTPRINMNIVASFAKLRCLGLTGVWLNGKYPCLLGFPHLQKLQLCDVAGLKLDLETVATSFPLLECLHCDQIPNLRGSLQSLRALKDTIREVIISVSSEVCGNIMDMADFPLLSCLNLIETAVMGDVGQIGDRDFPSLQRLHLPVGVYGNPERPFERVDDATEVMNALCRLKKRNVTLINGGCDVWRLSGGSPDHYPMDILSRLQPPFLVEIVKVGQRIGWRWINGRRYGCCKTNWIGEEPDRESDDSAAFWRELTYSPFKGFTSPPTAEEYRRLSTHW